MLVKQPELHPAVRVRCYSCVECSAFKHRWAMWRAYYGLSGALALQLSYVLVCSTQRRYFWSRPLSPIPTHTHTYLPIPSHTHTYLPIPTPSPLNLRPTNIPQALNEVSPRAHVPLHTLHLTSAAAVYDRCGGMYPPPPPPVPWEGAEGSGGRYVDVYSRYSGRLCHCSAIYEGQGMVGRAAGVGVSGTEGRGGGAAVGECVANGIVLKWRDTFCFLFVWTACLWRLC